MDRNFFQTFDFHSAEPISDLNELFLPGAFDSTLLKLECSICQTVICGIYILSYLRLILIMKTEFWIFVAGFRDVEVLAQAETG